MNLFRFNLAYRRFRTIEGTFCGLEYEPEDLPGTFFPISYHKEYKFPGYGDRCFILVPPLRSDYVTGFSTLMFQEVLDPAIAGDGTEDGDKQEYNYIFEK